jgi:hypothetical protein
MRRRPGPRTHAIAAALVVLVVVGIDAFIPYLTRERDTVASVPVPEPFGAAENIPLAPGQELCLDAVAMDVDAEIAEFTVISKTKSGPPLRVSAIASGYDATGDVEGGYNRRWTGRYPPQPVRVQLDPPTRSLLAQFCISNRGDRTVDMFAAHDARTASRPVARVDGQEVAPDPALRFLSTRSESVLARLGSLIDRASAFHPTVFETPVIWLLLALLVFVLPASAIYALASSFGADD